MAWSCAYYFDSESYWCSFTCEFVKNVLKIFITSRKKCILVKTKCKKYRFCDVLKFRKIFVKITYLNSTQPGPGPCCLSTGKLIRHMEGEAAAKKVATTFLSKDIKTWLKKKFQGQRLSAVQIAFVYSVFRVWRLTPLSGGS